MATSMSKHRSKCRNLYQHYSLSVVQVPVWFVFAGRWLGLGVVRLGDRLGLTAVTMPA
jgi:hypothetical protein